MAVETFEYIDDLNVANPTATDNVSEGDDHLRGLKTTLKNTFPNVTGAINATETELNVLDMSAGSSTSGQVLTSTGTGTVPTWQDSGGTLDSPSITGTLSIDSGGTVSHTVANWSDDITYTITPTNCTVGAVNSSGVFVVTHTSGNPSYTIVATTDSLGLDNSSTVTKNIVMNLSAPTLSSPADVGTATDVVYTITSTDSNDDKIILDMGSSNFTYSSVSVGTASKVGNTVECIGFTTNNPAVTIQFTAEATYSVTAKSVNIAGTYGDSASSSADSITIAAISISATGGTITTPTIDGTNYKVHTFTTSGSFVVSNAPAGTSVDVLLIGGGAGGGSSTGGGGGGGGVIHGTTKTVSATTYTITIGGGGASSSGSDRTGQGGSGGATTGFGYTSNGGGGGADGQRFGDGVASYGVTGANGGGAGGDDTGSGGSGNIPGTSNSLSGGTDVAYGGYAGGESYGDAPWQAGGGGGAGEAGQGYSAASSVRGDGGDGKQLNIDGNNYYWAGGGGAGKDAGNSGDGGLGGGGAGAGDPGAVGGSAINSGGTGGTGGNTSGGTGGDNSGGGGGGGTWSSGDGAAGGSGIVIVRYAV